MSPRRSKPARTSPQRESAEDVAARSSGVSELATEPAPSAPAGTAGAPATPNRITGDALEAVFEHAPVGVLIGDVEDRVLHANPMAERLLGRSLEDLVGSPLTDHARSADESADRRLLDELLSGRCDHYRLEKRFVTPDDEEVRAFVTVSLVDEPTTGRPLVVAVIQDVSELSASMEQLRAHDALRHLGEMAGAVAHEVRNALAGVKAAIEIIERRLEGADPLFEVVETIGERVRSLDAKVRELLRLARPMSLRHEPVPVRELLEGAGRSLRQLPAFEGARVEVEGAEVRVACDRELLEGAVTNLVRNAAEAMGGGGTVRGVLRRDGDRCVLRIEDDGPGIPHAVRDRVFEPFFTTKHDGTGLGLVLARRIVEAHGGTLRLAARPGGGTAAVVSLPATAEDAA